MGHCKHLSIEEREDAMLPVRQRKSVREIARAIGRDKSTVSRELRRNSFPVGAESCYRASTACRRHEERRPRCRRTRLMDSPQRRAPVVPKVRGEGWSPERIEGRIREERPELAVSLNLPRFH